MIKHTSRSRWNTPILFAAVLAVALFGFSSAVMAQGETEPDEEFNKLGKLYGELEGWAVQPAGADFKPASIHDPTNVANTRLLGIDPSTENRFRVRAGYRLKDNMGEFMVTYTSMNDAESMQKLNPGEFIYGILLTGQQNAGVFNDGLADGFIANAGLKTRDFRIDFYRDAFKGHRISSKWFIGYRRVIHERNMAATYFALAPDVPNVLNPISGVASETLFRRLQPRADTAFQSGTFNGRGLETGMTFKMNLGSSKKVWAEADVSLALLRGKIESEYLSTTHRYILRDTGGNFLYELAPPYDEFEDFDNPGEAEPTATAERIRQQNLRTGLNVQSDSGASMVMEMAVSLRWRVWKNLDVFGGIRQSYYENVGVDLRPRSVTPAGNQVTDGVDLVVNQNDATRDLKSITYEGMFFGIAYTY
ncbi:MAG: hypothetical protein IFK94_00305 [Acidobacteria bacterium]|uniref:Uncharacterized protein n=1 Tax=Candidatus Polarisedimenticola svalbardensis TaxID=2886004 RepID=A0A8J6XXJ0_9BACT|nr:hypothetical protein [Candidatus Polarisedimenticola svalbardensis]